MSAVCNVSVYCVTVFISVFVVLCVAYSNVVFMELSDSQCGVARLFLHCLKLFILVFRVKFITYINVVLLDGTT